LNAYGRYTHCRRFMWMKSKTDALISPTVLLDRVWHLHILDTRGWVRRPGQKLWLLAKTLLA